MCGAVRSCEELCGAVRSSAYGHGFADACRVQRHGEQQGGEGEHEADLSRRVAPQADGQGRVAWAELGGEGVEDGCYVGECLLFSARTQTYRATQSLRAALYPTP